MSLNIGPKAMSPGNGHPSGTARRVRLIRLLLAGTLLIAVIALATLGIISRVSMSHRRLARELTAAVLNGDAQAVDRLLKSGAPANAMRTDDDAVHLPIADETVLMTAAESGNVEVVKLLIAHGANVNAANNLFGTPKCVLTYGIVGENPAVVEALLDAGASPHFRSNNGCGLLEEAVIGDRAEVVKLLCAAGADVNEQDDQGDTPLRVADSEHASKATIQALLAAGATQ